MTDVKLVRRQLNAVIMNTNREIVKSGELLATTPLDSLNIGTSLAKLNNYEARIVEYSQVVLESLTDEAAIESEISKIESLRDILTETISKMAVVMKKLDGGTARNGQPHDDGLANSGHWVNGSSDVSVKLPKLQMAKFSGDPMKFQEFWDTFETTIHQNSKLAPVEKFKYLRSYLDGNALVLAEGYSLTSANYESVIAVLKERYGDPDLAIFCHLDALLALSMAGTKAHEIQKAYDDCECHIRSLVGLGMPEGTFGRVFVPILLSKMPTQVRVALHQKKGSGVCWTLTELREMIRTEIYARQMGIRSFGNTKDPYVSGGADRSDVSRVKNRSMGAGPPTASTLYTSSQGSQSARCRFCGAGHYSDICRKYPNLEARKKALGNGCFTCLRKGHTAADCRSKQPCFFCKRDTHHRSLCSKQFGKDRKEADFRSVHAKVASGIATGTDVNSTIVTRGKRGVLQTAVAEVAGQTLTVKARLLLDVGSDNSFATNIVLKNIGARKKGTDVVGLAGFQSQKRSLVSSPVHEICLSLRSGKQIKFDVYGTDVITCPIKKHCLDASRNPILSQLTLAEPLSDSRDPVEVDILLGSDHYYDIVKSERIQLDDGLLLLDSELGYILAGRVESSSSSAVTMVASLSRHTLPDCNFDLERFWRLEDIGVKDSVDTCDDELALLQFNESVQFNQTEMRYQVKWPWKKDKPELPDNFNLAFGRLKSLVKRTEDKEEIREKYEKTIDEQRRLNIIEEAPRIADGDVVHYIPHHGVVTPLKTTTKLRIVYDASCRSNREACSLNDCLYRGPVMLQDLCGLLIRFRLSPIGIVCDLEKAFLQIGLQTPDRDAVRFLWVRDPTRACTPSNVVHYRFRRVCFGVVSSPFLLAATVDHHLRKMDCETARLISDNIYVDNVIVGKDTTQEATAFHEVAKDIFQKASMNLREFFSNDANFIANIPDQDRGSGVITKTLGLIWDTEQDSLTVPIGNSTSTPHENITKRQVLRHIAKIFDPCGFFAPLTIVGKLLMQELWKKKYDWDTALSEDIVKQWITFSQEFNRIPSFRVPRFIGVSASLIAGRAELHCFCDASSKAYCAVTYMRVPLNDSCIVELLFAKSRVAPLKMQTIPRLELLAISIGVKMLDFLQAQLHEPVARRILWSDSQCALQWIVKSSVSTTFVKNRVQKIKESSGIEFRYVPTLDNPADYPTRGQSFQQLSDCRQWWHGPPWLSDVESSWRSDLILPSDENEAGMEGVALAVANNVLFLIHGDQLRFLS